MCVKSESEDEKTQRASDVPPKIATRVNPEACGALNSKASENGAEAPAETRTLYILDSESSDRTTKCM